MSTSSYGMRLEREPSYPGTVDTGSHGESAALVALLQTRPQGMGWPEITAAVLETGSAREVWHRLVPAALLPAPGQTDPLDSANQELRRWADQGIKVMTILDASYPVRLRGIHQAPPILFARGTLRAEDPAVSVVGSRRASAQGPDIAAGVARGLVSRGVTVAAWARPRH